MIEKLTASVGATRADAWRYSLSQGGKNAIASEWEIAVGYCLSTIGEVTSAPMPLPGTRQPDFIFQSSETSETVAVEVTAVSDEYLHEQNPIHQFLQELYRLERRERIADFGQITYEIGHVESKRGVRLAIPRRNEIKVLFYGPTIKEFIRRIRIAPHQRADVTFSYHGAQSTLTYMPGRGHIPGGWRQYTGIASLDRNPLVGRLRDKAHQIKKSGLWYPAIVFICDNDCNALTAFGGGASSAAAVSDLFLNGRRPSRIGPLIIEPGKPASTSHVNAIILLAIREHYEVFHPRPRRSIGGEYVHNRGSTFRTLSKRVVETVLASLANLPPVRITPANARAVYPLPMHYGGYTIRDGLMSGSIKLSLLGLQRLLSGEIPAEQFQRDHPDAIEQASAFSRAGLMISTVSIEECPDEDDDWIVFEFGRIAPDRLFKKKGQRD